MERACATTWTPRTASDPGHRHRHGHAREGAYLRLMSVTDRSIDAQAAGAGRAAEPGGRRRFSRSDPGITRLSDGTPTTRSVWPVWVPRWVTLTTRIGSSAISRSTCAWMSGNAVHSSANCAFRPFDRVVQVDA